MNVPPMPSLDGSLVDRHVVAHDRLAGEFHAHDDATRRLFHLLQHRLLLESLAYLQAVQPDPYDVQLFPAPRAFLTSTQQRRVEGARAAFRHIDSRVVMRRQGLIPSVVDTSTPLVLHALLEGTTTSQRETNPGMFRASPIARKEEVNPFQHPPSTQCAELVAQAIDLAVTASAPACARAAWLTFTMLSIHPFVDGNGRTSRSLYLAMVAGDLPLGIDWGVMEHWCRGRPSYIAALQAGQRVERYDPGRMDASRFMDFATESSIDGAMLCGRRLTSIATSIEQLTADGIDERDATMLIAIGILRVATWTELEGVGATADVEQSVGALLEAGRIGWVDRPPSRRTAAAPDRFGLVLATR